jgi:hypothetical protein
VGHLRQSIGVSATDGLPSATDAPCSAANLRRVPYSDNFVRQYAGQPLIFLNVLAVIQSKEFGMDTDLTTQTDAFRALYASSQKRIRALLNRMVGAQDAEDLTQVTFAKAAQALPGFRGEAKISTWLHRLAVNVALDWLRSRPTSDY